jgi:hypothetical protein
MNLPPLSKRYPRRRLMIALTGENPVTGYRLKTFFSSNV